MRRFYRIGATIVFVLAATTGSAAQESDPVRFHADRERAGELIDGESYAEALPIVRRLVRANPDDAELRFWIGWIGLRTDDPTVGVEGFEPALRLGYRWSAMTALRLARMHVELGRSDRALTWLERSLAEGLSDRGRLWRDEALVPLHDDPRFAELAGPRADPDLPRTEALRRDLAYLVAEARRLNPAPGAPARSEAFTRAAEAIRRRIPELTDDAFFLEVVQLVARLGDGHSAIYNAAIGGPDAPPFGREMLPVTFYRFRDGLVVIDAVGDARRWIGSRVVAFGDRPAEDLMEDVARYVNADNPFTVRWLAPRNHLRNLLVLRDLGVVNDDGTVTLVLESRDGERREVRLAGGIHPYVRKLRPPPRSDATVPRYLRDVGTHAWLEVLADRDAVYVQFNRVRDMEGETLEAFAGRMRSALRTSGAGNLIVDVRHNNGGNNALLRPWLRTLIAWEMAAPDHRIYVLVGRNTFSAAQNFVNRVDRDTDAVFVGEATGSRPNFTGEETTLVLPNTGIRGSLSNLYWQDSDPADHRRWIEPEIPVELDSTAWWANRDPALEAVFDVIERRRAESR